MSFDIRIMAMPSRRENVERLQKELDIPDDNVFYDEKHEGAFVNARRAWLKPTDCDHILVLQDDVVVCDDFKCLVSKCIEKHPNDIISYFSTHDKVYDTPYLRVMNKNIGAPAISMPADVARTIWEEGPNAFFNKDKADDKHISLCAFEHGIDMLCIQPSLVQHIGDESTITSRPVRRNAFFDAKQNEDIFDDDDVVDVWFCL